MGRAGRSDTGPGKGAAVSDRRPKQPLGGVSGCGRRAKGCARGLKGLRTRAEGLRTRVALVADQGFRGSP